MNSKQFWALIDASCRETRHGCAEQAEWLVSQLTRLPAQEIEDFHARLKEAMSEAYTWDLWGAAYIINGGCSDDCFDYFRGWLIGQGAAVFYSAFRDPESLVSADID